MQNIYKIIFLVAATLIVLTACQSKHVNTVAPGPSALMYPSDLTYHQLDSIVESIELIYYRDHPRRRYEYHGVQRDINTDLTPEVVVLDNVRISDPIPEEWPPGTSKIVSIYYSETEELDCEMCGALPELFNRKYINQTAKIVVHINLAKILDSAFSVEPMYSTDLYKFAKIPETHHKKTDREKIRIFDLILHPHPLDSTDLKFMRNEYPYWSEPSIPLPKEIVIRHKKFLSWLMVDTTMFGENNGY